jgi:hypothetical protein
MKCYKFILCFIILVSSVVHLEAQDTIKKDLNDLAFYADAAMNAVRSDHRSRSNDSVITHFESIISQTGSFALSFDALPWISTIYAPDSSFRVFSWQLNQADSLFSYYGYLQFDDGALVKFIDNEPAYDLSYAQLNPENWLGARYYEMVPFEHKGEAAYLLLGFDAHSRWNRRKIAEPLFIQDRQVQFGIPVFGKEGIDFNRNGKSRIILTYSLETKTVLTYDEDIKMLIHDHFISFDGRFPGQGRTQVPDGSYEGYRLDDAGNWIYKEKLFDQILEKPPVDSSKLSSQHKRDLFGNSRDKN